MKRINLFLLSAVAAVALLFVVSCGGGNSERENVFDKKVAAYAGATAKVASAKGVAELNEINAALESEIAAIDEECADEIKKIFEQKVENVDAFRSDEDSLKRAQTNYDDAYIVKYLELAEAASPEI